MKKIAIFILCVVYLTACTVPSFPSSFSESQPVPSSFVAEPDVPMLPSTVELFDKTTVDFLYEGLEDVPTQTPQHISQSVRILQENGFLYYLSRKGGADSICRLELETQVIEIMMEAPEKVITSFLPLSDTELLVLYELSPQEIEAIDSEHPSLFSDGPMPSQLFIFDMETGRQQSVDKVYDVPLLPIYTVAKVAENIFYGQYCIRPSGKVTQYPKNWELKFDSKTLYGYDTKDKTIILLDSDAGNAVPILKTNGTFPVVRGNKAYFLFNADGESASKLVVLYLDERTLEKTVNYQWPHPPAGFLTEIVANADGYQFLDKTVSDDMGIRPEFTSVQLICYDLNGNITHTFPAFTQAQQVYDIDYVVYSESVYYLVEDTNSRRLDLAVLNAI